MNIFRTVSVTGVVLTALLASVLFISNISFAETATTTSENVPEIPVEITPEVAPVKIAVQEQKQDAVGMREVVFSQVETLEQDYFNVSGKYLQVKKNNQLPEYESGTVAEKLGQSLPLNTWVDVYEGPNGKGYIVHYEIEGENGIDRYTKGFGPEADQWTFERLASPIVASSTEEVIQ